MNSSEARTRLSLVLAVVALCLAFTLSMSAQVQTDTSTETGNTTTTTTVERGEVVYVSGNDLVVKMEDGTIRHFANVSESARITVGDQQLGIHDLKPGMQLQRTITTSTTPKTITTVKSVTGTVFYVQPPINLILTMANGKNQKFTIPKDQKFNVGGQMVDAWGLKKGMKISATKVVEVPETLIAQQRKLTGTLPPPPPPPPADTPILVVEETAAPVQVASAELPKTASPLPLIGFLGLLSLASAFGLKAVRTKLG